MLSPLLLVNAHVRNDNELSSSMRSQFALQLVIDSEKWSLVGLRALLPHNEERNSCSTHEGRASDIIASIALSRSNSFLSESHVVARNDISLAISSSLLNPGSSSDLVKSGPITVVCFQLTGLLPLPRVVPRIPVVSAVDAGIGAPVHVPVVLALRVEYLAVVE